MLRNNARELTQMATSAEVVARGSFTAAADSLGVSKAFVSKQVSSLELSLGLVLLRRTTRRLRVTEEGERFYDYCRRLLETAQEALQMAQRDGLEPSGLLRISAPITFGLTFLTRLVEDFSSSFPRVEVDLVMENRFVDMLEEGFDAAFRITENPPLQLALTPIGMMEDIVCGSPHYLEGRPPLQEPVDLRQHDCLLYLHAANAQPTRVRRWTFRKQSRIVVVEVAGKTAYNFHSGLLAPLLQGKGLAKLPRYFVRDELASGRLVHLLPDYHCDQLPIHLVHPELASAPARLRRFVEFASQWFSTRIDSPQTLSDAKVSRQGAGLAERSRA